MAKEVKIRSFPRSIDQEHPDFGELEKLRAAILRQSGGRQRLETELPAILQDAIDFVIDPVRTARNRISELDNVEKTFVGLKIEHYLRDFLDVPKGIRDLHVDGQDVDVKNTVGVTWMIPPETYRIEEPCLLIAIADNEKRFWLGLMLARSRYLGKMEGNRDKKRSVTREGMRNILWLVAEQKLPPSRYDDLDMKRFRELRALNPGKQRAATFFLENLGRVTHRTVVQSLLHDQDDFMKRLRSNGGARDILAQNDVLLFSGAYKRDERTAHGFKDLKKDEFVAVRKRSDQF